MEHSQCVPFDWHLDNTSIGFSGLDSSAISDGSSAKFRKVYNDNSTTSNDVFYYIYALFNSAEYKKKYSNNLGKEMPRIPYLKDFKSWQSIGKKLAELHLDYEKADPYQSVKIIKKNDDYKVQKIRFLAKDKKDTIIFNDNIVISNIPLQVYDYQINGRSPLEWVIDQYQYSVDKESGIIDDPNKFDENKGGKYVFDLILSLITVSLETQKLIKELPEYKEI